MIASVVNRGIIHHGSRKARRQPIWSVKVVKYQQIQFSVIGQMTDPCRLVIADC